MDTYLPADFHRLHDASAVDWRDASTTPALPGVAKLSARPEARSDGDRIVDPGWVAI
ncbi:MAG: hypothetical protein ABI846_05350 [Rudaea sp.]